MSKEPAAWVLHVSSVLFILPGTRAEIQCWKGRGACCLSNRLPAGACGPMLIKTGGGDMMLLASLRGAALHARCRTAAIARHAAARRVLIIEDHDRPGWRLAAHCPMGRSSHTAHWKDSTWTGGLHRGASKKQIQRMSALRLDSRGTLILAGCHSFGHLAGFRRLWGFLLVVGWRALGEPLDPQKSCDPRMHPHLSSPPLPGHVRCWPGGNQHGIRQSGDLLGRCFGVVVWTRPGFFAGCFARIFCCCAAARMPHCFNTSVRSVMSSGDGWLHTCMSGVFRQFGDGIFLGGLQLRAGQFSFCMGSFEDSSAWRSCSSQRATFASAFFILAVAESKRAPGFLGSLRETRSCSSWLSRSSRRGLSAASVWPTVFRETLPSFTCRSLLWGSRPGRFLLLQQ